MTKRIILLTMLMIFSTACSENPKQVEQKQVDEKDYLEEYYKDEEGAYNAYIASLN